MPKSDGSLVLPQRMRDNGLMPKYARPAGGEYGESAVALLGNNVRAGIIRVLRENPGVTSGTICEALHLPPTTVVPYLSDLEDAGLVIAHPPKASRRKGEWVEYRVNDPAVTEVWLRLGQAIGEI